MADPRKKLPTSPSPLLSGPAQKVGEQERLAKLATDAASQGGGTAPDSTELSDPTSVSERVTGLMSKNNPLMRQARTRGMQASNRRGLLNTTMGAQAGESAMLEQVVPIASQEAQQAFQDRIAKMNVAADERRQASQLAAQFENSYASMISNIMNNPEIPSGAREKYIRHAAQVRDSNFAMVEQMYGIELEWATPQGAGSGGTSQQSVNQINQQADQISSLEEQIKKLQEKTRYSGRRHPRGGGVPWGGGDGGAPGGPGR